MTPLSAIHRLGLTLIVALGVLVAPQADAAKHKRLNKAFVAQLQASGWLPPGASVAVVRVTGQDRHVMAGTSPRVELHGRSWSADTLTARVTSGRRGARRTGWVRFTIRVTAPVVVAARDVRRHRRLRAEDLRVRKQTVRPRDRVAADTSALIGRTVRRDIRAGSLVAEHWLAPDVASRGDVLAGELRQGPLTLKFSLELLQRARVGKVVRARVVSTGKVVRARLVSRTRAEVVP